MPTNVSPSYSPLLGLARKALLWIVLPVGLVFAVLYGLATYETQSEHYTKRAIADTRVKREKALAAHEAAVERQYQQAVNHPDAKRLEAELSKLTPEQRAKRVGELMEEHARKVRSGQQ